MCEIRKLLKAIYLSIGSGFIFAEYNLIQFVYAYIYLMGLPNTFSHK